MSSKVESPRPAGPVPGVQRLTRAQFAGVTALLVGVSQQLVGTFVLDGLSTFVVAGGGSLLVLFGCNLFGTRSRSKADGAKTVNRDRWPC